MSISFIAQLVLGQVLATASEVLVEATVDTGTDFLVDKLNAKINEMFPNQSDPNSFSSQFLQNVKMQTTVAAQARMMSVSMASQQKVLTKIDEYKDKVKLEQKEAITGFKDRAANFISKGKHREKTDKIINDKLNEANTRVSMMVNGQKNASQQVGAFTQGLGSTKLAYDNANDNSQMILNANMLKLLSGMGYFENKTSTAGA